MVKKIKSKLKNVQYHCFVMTDIIKMQRSKRNKKTEDNYADK